MSHRKSIPVGAGFGEAGSVHAPDPACWKRSGKTFLNILLERRADAATQVILFSDSDESWTFEIVRSEKILSVEKVVDDVLNQVVNDLVLIYSWENQNGH